MPIVDGVEREIGPLRPLTEAENKLVEILELKPGTCAFEAYPADMYPKMGRFWTWAELERLTKFTWLMPNPYVRQKKKCPRVLLYRKETR